ncbi:MAG: hypothetical protein CVU88_08570, partial [Firmicutes bacterium HGW-Firmicutes-13]
MKIEDDFPIKLLHHLQLVEIIPSSIIIHAPDGSVFLANSQFAMMFGYRNPSELTGKSFFNYISSKDHEYFRRNIEKAKEEGISRQAEYTFIRNDSTSFSGGMSTSISSHSKDKCFIINVIADITGRKYLEKR